MSTEIEIRSLRQRIAQRAIQRESENSEREAADRARRRARLRVQLIKTLGLDERAIDDAMIEISGEGGRPEYETEGFRFTLDVEGDLALVRPCPYCLRITTMYVGGVDSLIDIDSKPLCWPHGGGDCVKKEQSGVQTTEERFLLALRDFIAENSYKPE